MYIVFTYQFILMEYVENIIATHVADIQSIAINMYIAP